MSRIFSLIIVNLIIMINFVVFIPEITDSAELHHLEDDSGDFTNKTIGISGGSNLLGNVSIEKGLEIYDAYFNLTGLPDANGNYPTSFTIYVDRYNYPNMVYAFYGPGSGSMGHQWAFSPGNSEAHYNFKGKDNSNTISFLLPKRSNVTSASIQIEGKHNLWGEPRVIDNDENYIGEIHPADINGDGAMDMVSAGNNKVVWYNNTDGNGTVWNEITISSLQPAAMVVYAFDVDNDNDTDVVVASRSAGYPGSGPIYYYRNMDGKGESWDSYLVTKPNQPIYNCYNLEIADMDNDGDGDIVVTSTNGTQPAGPFWFNNTDGNGSAWVRNQISTSYTMSYGLLVMDVDSDGDNDTVVTNYLNRQIHWFENLDGKATSWSTQYLVNEVYSGFTFDLVKGDIDLDGDLDIVATCADGIRWYSQPTNTHGFWPTYDIIITGGFWNDDFDIAVGDFGSQMRPPDGKPDIVFTSYLYNYVFLYENKCSTTENSWETYYLNFSHVDAFTIKVADINNDSYDDVIVGAYSLATENDIIWYNMNISYPSDIKLDIGSDGVEDWASVPGLFNSTVEINNLKDTLNSLVAKKPVYSTDVFGQDFVLIELDVQTSTGGRITFSELDIKYDYTVKVTGQDAYRLSQILDTRNSDPGPGNNSIPIYVYSMSNTGRLKIDDIKIIYNGPPVALPTEEFEIFEDTRNDKLINLSHYFEDDYITSDMITYEIVSYSNHHYVDVFTNKLDDLYLGVDSESGDVNDDWTGSTAVIVRATDDKGLSVESDPIIINIVPVNDEPVIGTKKLLDINIIEGLKSPDIDLDAEEYFADVDSTDLYFDYALDPLNENDEYELFVELDDQNWVLTVNALGDWYTIPDESVRLRIFCDDDPVDINQSGAYRDIFIKVSNLNDDAPRWSLITDIIMNEDEPLNDAFNLLSLIDDIDNKESDLKFNVESVSDKSVYVDIDSQVNIDISTATNYFGTSTVVLNATDGTNYNTTTFQINVENVNDIPTAAMLSPRNDRIIYFDYIHLTWQGSDIDPGDNEALTYDIYLDNELGNTIHKEDYNGISINITDLADRTTYYWKVIPNDGTEDGICTSDPMPYKFTVDLSKKPHSVLSSPKDDLTTNQDKITLNWDGYSSDDDAIWYTAYVSTENLSHPYFGNVLEAEMLVGTELEINFLVPNTRYYWTVIPNSIKGEGICDSGVWSFYYDPSAVMFKLQIEAPEQLTYEKSDFYLEEIRVTNLGVNPDIFTIGVSAGLVDYLIDINSEGSEQTIDPGETLHLIMNISAEKMPIGTYDLDISVMSLGSGEVEHAELVLEIYEKKDKEAENNALMYSSMIFIAIIIAIVIIFFILMRNKRLQDEKKYVDAELVKPIHGDRILEAKDVKYVMGSGDKGIDSLRTGGAQADEPYLDTLTAGAKTIPLLPPTRDEIERVLQTMLEQLDAKFINGDVSEETYLELKQKYEERLEEGKPEETSEEGIPEETSEEEIPEDKKDE